MPCQRLHLGLKHWDHASLDESFYPALLPEDWKFDFMAGVSNALWLRPEHVSAENLAVLAEAAERVRAVIEWPDETRRAVLSAWLAMHSDRVIAVVGDSLPTLPGTIIGLRPGQIWTPTQPVEDSPVALLPPSNDLRQLRGWVDAFTAGPEQSGCALFIDGAPPSTGVFERIHTMLEVMGW